MLVSLVWAALFFMSGVHWFWIAGIGGAGFGAALIAYQYVSHVRARVLKFIDPGAGGGMVDTFQVDTALDSFLSGGWFGKGPGEGTIKRILPDAHTDFIFAVTAEEFGVLACLVIASIFAFIVLRGLFVAARQEDPFCRFAAAGLVILFGIQSAINMAVNLHLIPAKGMTLPFISYGGSSLISLALAIGFLIAVLRKRPGVRGSCRVPGGSLFMSGRRPIVVAAGGTGGHLVSSGGPEPCPHGARVRGRISSPMNGPANMTAIFPPVPFTELRPRPRAAARLVVARAGRGYPRSGDFCGPRVFSNNRPLVR